MSESEFERTLRQAFDAQARASVGDDATPPAPRFAQTSQPSRRPHGRLVRWAAPLTAAAAVVAIVGVVAGISQSSSGDENRQAAASQSVAHSPTSTPSSASTTPVDPNAVHVKLLNDDGAHYGVGMPVIAYFSQNIVSGKMLQEATKATVNGTPVQGAWYFEKSAAGKGPIEAHFRMAHYWPADADVRVTMPIKGLSAGGALTYDDSLTTAFHTGPTNIATVSERTHQMVVTTDGKKYDTVNVSLGAKNTPTRSGIKVIMEQSQDVTLRTSADDHTQIQYAQRLTYAGEYLCAAPWNVTNINAHIDTSGGSTNLLPADAKKLFHFFHIGDIVQYVGVTGTPMTIGSGYGDWNVSWPTWLKGGLVPTH
jgi:lipoprotein-anchoring transpeptidase ErfK/SrfK